MLKKALVVLWFLTAASTILAQTTLPHPATIFDDSVTILQVHPVVDNVQRTLTLYQDDAWQTIPYPNYLTEIDEPRVHRVDGIWPSIFQRPDQSYIFLEPEHDEVERRTWVTNPEYTRLHTISLPCGEDTTLSQGNSWIYTSIGEETYLCNGITSEVSPPLPEPGGSWGYTGYSLVDQPDMSPDGRYLILRGALTGNNYGDRFYSYEIETRTFRVIGEVRGFFDHIGFSYWLSPSYFVVTARDMPEWSTTFQYVGNAGEINSLQSAISMLRFFPCPVYDPPGLEVMYAVMGDGQTAGPCFINFYDAETGQTRPYDTGALCEYGIPIPDGSGDQLFRAIYPSAVVVRYNVFTGTRQNLYVGEVETLGPVAPDGSRGLIALDDSGVVDTDQDPEFNFGVELEPTEYVVMDLDNGDILGSVPADVEWLTASYLYNQEHLYTVTDDGVTLSDLPGALLLALPDREQLLIETPEDTLIILNAADGSTERVATLPPGYDAAAMHLSQEGIRLGLFDPAEEAPTLIFDVLLP